MKYLKKMKKDEIIMGILFIIISVSSVIAIGWTGLILIPIMLLMIIVYYNINSIEGFTDKLMKKIKSKKKTKIYDVEDMVEDSVVNDDIIIRKEEKKEGVNVKKISSRKGKRKKNSKNNKNTIKKTNRKWWKRLLTIVIIGGIALIMAVAALMIYIVCSAGTFDPDALSTQDQTVIYDSSGNEMATLGREKRESITYDELPQVLVDAIIATEDSRFFQHNGVDMARFIKATAGQLIGNSSAGGASTLTMQVVKNNLTSTEKSIIRKLKDVYLSVFFVEKKYTKEEILEFYVNDSLLGGKIFGVEEASQYYFGKSVSELSLPEASLIAGLFQSPNGYNPYKYPEKAKARRATVLKLMVRHGYITQEEADFANSVSIESLLADNVEESAYQGYIDTVVEEVKDKTGFDPALVSMKIYTTMNKDIQDGIDGILSGKTYTAWENDYIQSGVAITDVNTGAIVAIGAGRNRNGERQWNFATMTKRQPGSTSKPLFDYGPGFEYNNFSTYTLFNDEPWTYTNGPALNNWDGGFYGLITLKTALSTSRNIPAVKAFQQVSKKDILKFVKGLGLNPALEDGALHEAYAIGGGSGFTPLEMAVAYASFANGGYYIEPYTVTKIEYRSTGKTEEYKYKKERVMAESTAYLINNVLQYAVETGNGGGATVYGSTVAAKTGTSNIDSDTAEKKGIPTSAVVDLWTCAYTPEYSIALWYGYEELSKEYYLNGSSTQKNSVMAAVMQNIPKSTTKWTVPDTVVESKVEFGTWPAQLPSAYTPANLISTEYFIKGTQPTETSNRFAKLNDVTNVKTSNSTSGTKLTWDYTIPKVNTEEYLKTYFSQSVFGNGTNGFVQSRLDYNKNTLGDLGFGIYVKDDSGNLERVGFTTKNEYTYSQGGSGAVTLVIKAEYANFKSNASDGVSKSVTLTGTTNELTLDINTTSKSIKKASYSHINETVTYNGKIITAKITYTLKDSSNTVNTFDNSTALETKINTLPVGEYTITYTVNYKEETVTEKLNLTIID